jgi:hypothetical protein
MKTVLFLAAILFAPLVAIADANSELQVTIAPPLANKDGALWRWWPKTVPTMISPWQKSDVPVKGLFDGMVVIEGSAPMNSACTPPPPQEVKIVPGQRTYGKLEYTGANCK